LHRAAHGGHDSVVEILLEAHAEVDKQDNDGLTALHLAVDSSRERVVEILLEANAEVDKRDTCEKPAIQPAGEDNTTILGPLEQWMQVNLLSGME